MEDLKQRKKNLIMFPLGTVGRDMIYYLFTSCIITFVLFTRNLTNAQFGAITAIVVAARIFDALNDPIMGNIIERTRTRWGKFKPWLVIGILSTSVVVYLAFNTDLQGWSFVWFFGVIYFLYSITYTMHDISYWGMVPALSPLFLASYVPFLLALHLRLPVSDALVLLSPVPSLAPFSPLGSTALLLHAARLPAHRQP